MGVRDAVLIFRHILPNCIGPLITRAMIAIPGAIFSESFLAYIGLGIAPPEPSIGILLADGQSLVAAVSVAGTVPGASDFSTDDRI